MEAYEFGKENEKKIILISGNMMSWRQFENVIPLLEKNYHVTAISTDGYDGKGTVFTTAEAMAEKLEEYIRKNLDSKIDLLFGESFGSATAAMLFYRRKVMVGSLIMSGPQYMNLGIFSKVLSYIIPRNQYRLLGRMKDAKKLPCLLKLYTRGDDDKLLKQFEYVPDHISFETLQNATDEALRLYGQIDDFEPDPEAKVSIWYGEKEPNMKTAIKKLKKAFPNAQLHPFAGYGHGQIMSDPERMAEDIKSFMEE